MDLWRAGVIRLWPTLAAAVLVGCMPVGRPVDGPAGPGVAGQDVAGQDGPTLVIDITNRSAAELEVGYKFEAENSSGGGAGTVAACQRMIIPFGSVSGAYAILVGGAHLSEGNVPPGARAGSSLVVAVAVAPDGEAVARPPRLVAAGGAARHLTQRLARCG